MPSINQLTSVARVTVAYGEANVAITYDQDKFSANLQKRLELVQARYESTNEEDETLIQDLKRQLAEILVIVGTGWDVDDGDEQHTPTPFTVVHLCGCAITFLSAALDAIAQDITRKNPAGKTSTSSANQSATISRRKGNSRRS